MVANDKTIIKPKFTMDAGKLSLIYKLMESATMLNLQVEQGYAQNIKALKASLKTLYTFIKRYAKEAYPEDIDKIPKLFDNIEDSIKGWGEQATQSQVTATIDMVGLAFDTLIEIADEVYTRHYETLPESIRARMYSMGGA